MPVAFHHGTIAGEKLATITSSVADLKVKKSDLPQANEAHT